MGKIDHVDVTDLEEALDRREEKRETMRLLTAIIYKRGPSVPMIAEWLDIREATIYRWFDRLEEESIEMAIRDRPREGRPPKLSETQREQFRAAVRGPPSDAGFDEPAWSPEIAREFLNDRFDVDYTERHVQRMLKAAGLEDRPAGTASTAGPADGRVRYWEPIDSRG